MSRPLTRAVTDTLAASTDRAEDLYKGCHEANKTSEDGWSHHRLGIKEGLSEGVTFQET